MTCFSIVCLKSTLTVSVFLDPEVLTSEEASSAAVVSGALVLPIEVP